MATNDNNVKTLTTATREALLIACKAIAAEGGKLWDMTRDAFNLAFHDLESASKASSTVSEYMVKVGGNPGSIRGYLSTLAWLHGKDGKAACERDKLDPFKATSGQADKARYPAKYAVKADPKTPQGKAQLAIERAEAAKKKAEAAAQELREYEASQTPRAKLLREAAAKLGTMTEDTLTLACVALAELLDRQVEQAPDDTAQVEAEKQAALRQASEVDIAAAA